MSEKYVANCSVTHISELPQNADRLSKLALRYKKVGPNKKSKRRRFDAEFESRTGAEVLGVRLVRDDPAGLLAQLEDGVQALHACGSFHFGQTQKGGWKKGHGSFLRN